MDRNCSSKITYLLIVIFPFILLACISTGLKKTKTTHTSSKQTFITDIKIDSDTNHTLLTFYSNTLVDFTSFVQKSPPSIILEIPDGYIHRNIQTLIQPPEEPIQRVEAEQLTEEAKVTARFTITMKENFPYEIKNEENKLNIIILYDTSKISQKPAKSEFGKDPVPKKDMAKTSTASDKTAEGEHIVKKVTEGLSLKYISNPTPDRKDIPEQSNPHGDKAEKIPVKPEETQRPFTQMEPEQPLTDSEFPKRDILRTISASSQKKGEAAETGTYERVKENEETKKRAASGTLDEFETILREKRHPLIPEKKFIGKPISLDFQNADIQSVLRIIADVSGYNLVIDPKVEGKVNISLLKPIPWDHALDVILKSNKLDMKLEGNVIRVGQPETFKMEMEGELNEIETTRKAQEEARKALPLSTKVISINYAKANVLVEKIRPMLSSSTGLIETPSLVVDERTNTLIVKDLPESIDKIIALISALDHPTPQVMIEARIVETTKNFLKDIGIQWGGTYAKETSYRFANTLEVRGTGVNTTGVSVDSPTGRDDRYAVDLPISAAPFGAIGINFGHINGSTSLEIQLKAMEKSGKIRLVSNPRIATLDNEEASIKSGTRIPYQTTDKEGNPSTSFVDAAIDLTVTPQITPDDNITMKIIAAKSEPDWSNAVLGVPAISTRTASTRLIVKDGDTAVIGGLNIQNKAQQLRKVPYLADIPIIGNLFKANDRSENFDEILIFITPKIIRELDKGNEHNADKILEQKSEVRD